MKIKNLVFALSIQTIVLTSAFAGTASGRVFIDANGNGKFDVGERGVGDCLISDERGFTRSDRDGYFKLELPAGPATVFAVNPSGTWPSARRWVYVADGTTDITCDFPLREQNQSGPLYFVHGTDIHLNTNSVPLYRRYIEHVNALPVPVKFVVHTGDLIIDGLPTSLERGKALFDLYEESSKLLKTTLFNVKGNHDVIGLGNPKLTGNEPGFGKAMYRQRFGPITYAFRYGPYHFISLDGTTLKGRKPVSGLTTESADWAIAYLATLKATEPIVLLIHEPLFSELEGIKVPDKPGTRQEERRLLEALKGKNLLMTLAGHAHARTISTWAGAPHLLGGAVSYAWHGFQPFPPSPIGYVLYRLEGDRQEHVYLDWAEERSIDVMSPAFSKIVSGKQKISGVINDFDGSISTVECAVANVIVPAQITARGPLADSFDASVDSTALPDGVYNLRITARSGEKHWEEIQPIIVVNEKPDIFRATTNATLRLQTDAPSSADIEVTCNGHILTPTEHSAHMVFDVPANILARLNKIVVRLKNNLNATTRIAAKNISMDYNGRKYHDVRQPPLKPLFLSASPVSFIDVVYEESNAGKR